MRCCCYPAPPGDQASTGLLALRVVMGAAFVLHGWPKIQNPTGWMGTESGVPGVFQAVAAAAEFGGGIALALGLLSRFAALGIAAVMVGALALVHIPKGDPYVGKPGQPSSELATVYLACSILFLLVGPGRFSIDAAIFGPPTHPEHAPTG
jgi:putative oxidoreductase